MTRTLVLALLGMAVGCGGSGPPDMPDSGPTDDAGLEACGPFPALADLTVSEGGRVSVPRDGALAEPSLVLEGRDGVTAVAETGRLLVYADYGTSSGTLRVRCSTGASTDLPVEVRPLAWSRLAEWEPGSAGPPAREYGAWWLAERGSAGLFVFGGFHYVPRQFTPASDLWLYDFEAATWTELSSTDPPVAPGGRVAAGAEPGSVLYLGGTADTGDGSIDTRPVLRELTGEAGSMAWSAAPFESTAPGSYTGAFIRDERRDRWLSVCGLDTYVAGINCRVYEYTPDEGFSQVFIGDGPVPAGRFGFHYGYDPETDRVVIAGGQTGPGNLDMIGDAWALELGEEPPRWVQLADDREDLRRRNGSFALDPVGRRLLIWGGTADGRTSVPGLYALGLDRGREEWTVVDVPAEVPARTSGIGVFDADNRRALFGFGNSSEIYTDLWSLAL